MNDNTSKRLRKNPYYLSNNQQLKDQEQIEYGGPEIHNDDIPTHEVRIKRKKRKAIKRKTVNTQEEQAPQYSNNYESEES